MSVPAAVDPAPLATLAAAVGEPTARRLLAMFVTGAPARLAVLRRTDRHASPADAQRAAHALKSTARQFGAVRLGQAAAAYERAAAEGRSEALAPLADAVAEAYAEFVRWVGTGGTAADAHGATT